MPRTLTGGLIQATAPLTDSAAPIAMGLDMIEEMRRVWQFYRDHRPETSGSMAGQLP